MAKAKELTINYWNNRYLEGKVGWDMGEVSPPIKAYIDQLDDKSVSILIPGAGNSYEAEYLFKLGFTNVYLLDYAQEAMKNFSVRTPTFPKEKIYVEDFFEHKGSYDIIIEQTLFCAINPTLRQNYADKVAQLLPDGAKLVGLMFNREFDNGPPFGGNSDEYLGYFDPHFTDIKMDACYNSIAERQGSEVFINMTR
ncbi:MAG: hypothetical protein ACI865_001453 [Flavobacteriaceae bacterium]|jgi:hypothetical protein